MLRWLTCLPGMRFMAKPCCQPACLAAGVDYLKYDNCYAKREVSLQVQTKPWGIPISA